MAVTPEGPLVSWVWAVVAVSALVYGSLIPFDVSPSIYAGSLMSSLDGLRFVVAPLSDRLLNIGIYVPIGFLVVLCLPSRGSITRGAIVAVICGLSVSVALEATQMHVHSRVGSWYDVILNLTGAGIGVWVAIAVRLWGVHLAKWVTERLEAQLFASISAVVAVGLLLYGLFPFDFVTTTEAMFSGFRHARWDLFSIRHASVGDPPFAAIVGQLAGAGCFAVLGYVSALANRERGRRPVVSFGLAVKHGMVLASVIEGMQLFTGSHVFDLASLVLRSLGVILGAWFATFVIDEHTEGRWRKYPGMVAPGLLLGIALLFQVSLLVADALGPGGWSLANVSAGSFSWIPFRLLWEQSSLTAIDSSLSILFSYGSVAIVVALLMRRRQVLHSWRLVTTLVCFVAFAIEIVKAGSLGRTPDPTDVILAFCASIVVWRFASALGAMRRSSSVV